MHYKRSCQEHRVDHSHKTHRRNDPMEAEEQRHKWGLVHVVRGATDDRSASDDEREEEN